MKLAKVNSVLSEEGYIYILSEDLLVEGDFVLERTGLRYIPPYQIKEIKVEEHVRRCKKVIGTNDPKLLCSSKDSIYKIQSQDIISIVEMTEVDMPFAWYVEEKDPEVDNSRQYELHQEEFLILFLNLTDKVFTLKDLENAYDSGSYDSSTRGNGNNSLFREFIKNLN